MTGSWLLFAIFALASVLPQAGAAQAEKPIYVQYEGYIKRDDKTVVLSFGYFNMNDVDLKIPAGERNAFLPPPIDRGQPVTFLKGRHQSACVIILPEGFDGSLQWRVQNGGTVSTTTAKVLDPMYAVSDASVERVTRGLQLETLPKGTCQTPQVTGQRR